MTIGFWVPDSGDWAACMERVERACPGHSLVRGPNACRKLLTQLDALVATRLEPRDYEAATHLKALFVPFVGVNHLPLDMLSGRGVSLYNCHGNADSVAERALALALAGLGRVVEYHNDLKNQLWHGFWVGRGRVDNWSSIRGKRAVILGTGAIGLSLAALLKAFGCTVLGFSRSARPAPGFDLVSDDLGTVLEGAQLVFAALPLTPQTRGIVDERALAKAKDAFFVNVGRADTVDEGALYRALAQGTLRGAGLDVWYRYPEDGAQKGPMAAYPFQDLPNVILSPHVAGSTDDAVSENIRQTGDNVMHWLKDDGKAKLVDPLALY